MNGIFSALLGVFNADGDINEDGVRALVRHNIDKCGIDGLYVNGSTGETFLMTMEMQLWSMSVKKQTLCVRQRQWEESTCRRNVLKK